MFSAIFLLNLLADVSSSGFIPEATVTLHFRIEPTSGLTFNFEDLGYGIEKLEVVAQLTGTPEATEIKQSYLVFKNETGTILFAFINGNLINKSENITLVSLDHPIKIVSKEHKLANRSVPNT